MMGCQKQHRADRRFAAFQVPFWYKFVDGDKRNRQRSVCNGTLLVFSNVIAMILLLS